MFEGLRSPAGEATVLEQNMSEWLAASRLPKLFIKGEPGAILSPGPFEDFRRSWPDQKEIRVPGIHYLQEDAPDAIGQAMADWLREL